MLTDGLKFLEGSSAQNLTISSGSSFPITATEGEAFYRNDGVNEGLYLYDGSTWIRAGFDASVSQNITGAYSFTQPISGVAPVLASDLTTKQYVDNVATGLDVKLSVKAATTGNITLSGAQTIDGVTLVSGDRVLVKDQSTGSQNGIYVVAAGAWARSADADNSPVNEVTSGMFTFVTLGTVNANKGFVLTTDDPITLGSTALTFAQFSGGGAVAPTLATTQIGFGSALNVLSGSTKFTWVDASNTVTLGVAGATTAETVITTGVGTTNDPRSPSLTILAGASGAGSYAGNITLKGGVGTGAGGVGGNVTISGGTGGWWSGNVTISSGGGAANLPGYLSFMTATSGAAVERLRILANGAWSVGSTGTAYGTSGQVLTSNGNGAPTWSTPSSGASLSAANTWTQTQTFSFAGTHLTTLPSSALNIVGGDNGNGSGGHLNLIAGLGSGSHAGGNVNITGGGARNGGYAFISGGAGGAGPGGNVVLSGGTGTGQGEVLINTSSIERFRITAAGAWSVGTGGVAYGTAGQVLTSAGNAPPTWATPSVSLSVSNTWAGTQTFGNIIANAIFSQTAGGLTPLTIQGTATSANNGGNSITILGGPNTAGATAGPGNVTLTGGDNFWAGFTGGNLIMRGGSSFYQMAPGGNVIINGGTGFTDNGNGRYSFGGNTQIAGGSGGSGGGNVSIKGGVNTPSSASGGPGGFIVFETAPSATLVERLRILNNGAWSVGATGTAYGTSGQVLTSNGNAAPTWSAQAVSSVAGRTGAVTLTVADIPDAQPKTLGLVSQSADYTCILADSGKIVLHPAADVTARTFTIPANASVPYPIGTVITFINQNAGGVISIAITTDTMRLAGPGTVGTRSLAANGLATATKITASEWIISGVGLT